MSITHCYSAGFYRSVTYDWSHFIGTTGLVIIISALGLHFRALSRIERTVQDVRDLVSQQHNFLKRIGEIHVHAGK